MKYKQMLDLGLTVSSESLDSMIPSLPVDGQYTDATLDDVTNIEGSMEDLSAGLHVLNGVATKLVVIRNAMLSSGPLSAVSVEAYTTAIDNLLNPLGLKDLMISAEGFAHDHEASLKYSGEGIQEVLNTIIERLIELIQAAVEKGKEYVTKLFGATEPLEKRLQTTLAKADKLSLVSASKPTVEITASEAEWIVDGKGSMDISMAVKAYENMLGSATYGKPEVAGRFIRSVVSIMKGWTTNVDAAFSDDAFKSVDRPPMSTGYNPKTGIDESFDYTPYALHISADVLPTIEFVHREDREEPKDKVQIPVVQTMAMVSFLTGLSRVVNTLKEQQARYEEVQTAMTEYGQVVESLKSIRFEDEEKGSRFRDVLMMVNASVRSFADYPIRAAAKGIHGVSALESVMSKMLSQGYGKSEQDAGATGTGAAAQEAS